MFFNGKKVIVQPPVKMFGKRWLKRKGRYGRKLQLVKYFVGWKDYLADDQIVDAGHSLVMNQKTWNKLETFVKQKEKQSSS